MKPITYAETRFFQWIPDDRSVSLRAAGGSYGGGSEVFVVQSVEDLFVEEGKPKDPPPVF